MLSKEPLQGLHTQIMVLSSLNMNTSVMPFE